MRIKLKLLDEFFNRAKNQAPEHLSMAAFNSLSSNSLCELPLQTVVVVIACIVVAHGGQEYQAAKVPLNLRQGLVKQIPSRSLNTLVFEFTVHTPASIFDSTF